VDSLRLLASSLVAAISAATASPAHARCHIENVTAIRVASNGNQLLTQGALDGHPVTVLIDTGAYMSFIWRSAAERLGLHLFSAPRTHMFGLGGESRVDATLVGELQVQSFTAKDLRLPVAGDVPSVVDFILGEDFLARGSVEFDVRHGAVRMMETSGCTPAELPYWSKTYSMADIIASPQDARAIRVPVVLNGHEFRAQIDSGSSVSLVAKSVADAAGVHYVSSSEQIVGIGHRTLETWIAEVNSFRLGDETINNTQLRVAQLDKYQTMGRVGTRIPVTAGTAPTILLGMDFLRTHRVVVDNTTRKMVFTYEGGTVFQITKPPESDEAPSDSARSASAGN
jgi:predicted aspartyl protease